MSRWSDDPVKHVVSFRVNDDEKGILDELVTVTGKNISALMRQTLYQLENEHLWSSRRQLRGGSLD